MTTKALLLGLVAAVGIAIAMPALARPVTIGYVGLMDDLRYHPEVGYTRIQITPDINPVEGARLAVEDLKVVTDAVDIQVTLDEQMAADAADVVAKITAMSAAGQSFIVLDLPGPMLAEVAPAVAGLPVTLLNATAPQDSLRALCQPNLMHAAASDRMISDTYTQFLRNRDWTRVLMLVGQEPRDAEIADSFAASAERLRIQIVDRRVFTLSTDPANREENNTMLVTGGVDYDVVFVADSIGEYARYLNYSTQLARPVIGATGLTAEEWHWSWVRDGASQVTLRFQRLAEGRPMSGYDYGAWISVKSILTAYAKARSEDPAEITAYLKGPRIQIDGSKGYRMNFRPWDQQIRQPLILHTFDAIIADAPFPEFLHQENVLDTLGTDQPESTCQLQ